MPNADRALLRYEAGQSPTAMSALTNAGDALTFSGVTGTPWSRRDGFAPVVRPNGLLTGGAITPAVSGSDDVVDVAAGTAYIGGELVTWSAATDVAITRGLTTDTHNITSITVTSAGSVVAVSGTDSTAFSETRDADGGPPLIAATSIEIGQVRTTSVTAAPVTAGEVNAVIGLHLERSDYPVYEIDHYSGLIRFADNLPLIHTGAAPKAVYASYATPVFADVSIGTDFVPPENSYAVSSTQVYNRTIASTSATLNAGSFTAYLNDGVTDPLVGLAGEVLWFKFFPNRYASAYIMSQGVLGIARSFPAGDLISASCTINAESIAVNVAS